MNKLLILSIILLSQLLNAQQSTPYSELLNQAWQHYQNKEYLSSGQKYKEAFLSQESTENLSNKEVSAHFNAACAFALAKEKKQAFEQLFIIAIKGKFSNYEQLSTDGDLKSLHDEPEWSDLTKIVNANYELIKPLNKNQLMALYTEYQKAQAQAFQKGSTVEDVDHLYSFYTDDFEYNHPGYGDVYSRELLYKNTVRYLTTGGYDQTKKRLTLNKIIGLNAIAIEQQYEGETETTMTLLKFRKDKIYYIHEYW